MEAMKTATQPSNSDRNFLKSLDRAAVVMETLAQARSPMSVAQLAQANDLDRSAVHRVVHTLARHDLVSIRSGRCQLGPGICRLNAGFLETSLFRRVGLPYVIELHRRLGQDQPWVASLVLISGDEVVILDRAWETTAPLESILDIGSRFPLDRAASGIAALAYMDEDEGTALIGADRLAAVAPQFDAIHAREGVAFYQLHADLCGIAGLVRDAAGTPVCAISVTGALSGHLRDDSEVVIQVRRVARHVESTLVAQEGAAPR